MSRESAPHNDFHEQTSNLLAQYGSELRRRGTARLSVRRSQGESERILRDEFAALNSRLESQLRCLAVLFSHQEWLGAPNLDHTNLRMARAVLERPSNQRRIAENRWVVQGPNDFLHAVENFLKFCSRRRAMVSAGASITDEARTPVSNHPVHVRLQKKARIAARRRLCYAQLHSLRSSRTAFGSPDLNGSIEEFQRASNRL